ncbi:hypothetical protein SADUNF_Sadunf16G0159000 [Salix dunnii]|uniref:Pentatricopeptide repeat-containing protein n=1 Tax=Salix dunnii TaxID=1413687 RepID=A0A835J725_9ROSI|nr:hypothetical protein SADUNF_Sadunf16G0159000 [Salix dunnii]
MPSCTVLFVSVKTGTEVCDSKAVVQGPPVAPPSRRSRDNGVSARNKCPNKALDSARKFRALLDHAERFRALSDLRTDSKSNLWYTVARDRDGGRTPPRWYGGVEEAMTLLEEMRRKGLEVDAVVDVTLINGRAWKALDLFDLMIDKGEEPRPDAFSYNTFILGPCSNCKVDEAMKLFSSLMEDGNYVEPDVIISSTVIQGLCKEGRLEEAVEIYDAMIQRGSFESSLEGYSICQGVAEWDASNGFDLSSLYLIKGFGLKDETEEVINLLRQMTDKCVVLVLEITNSILIFLRKLITGATIPPSHVALYVNPISSGFEFFCCVLQPLLCIKMSTSFAVMWVCFGDGYAVWIYLCYSVSLIMCPSQVFFAKMPVLRS